MLGNIAVMALLPRLGVWRSVTIGLVGLSVGWTLYGFLSVELLASHHTPDDIWVAQLVPVFTDRTVAVVAGCFAGNAYVVLVAQAVRRELGGVAALHDRSSIPH